MVFDPSEGAAGAATELLKAYTPGTTRPPFVEA